MEGSALLSKAPIVGHKKIFGTEKPIGGPRDFLAMDPKTRCSINCMMYAPDAARFRNACYGLEMSMSGVLYRLAMMFVEEQEKND